MAQPDAEPVEEHEYVPLRKKWRHTLQHPRDLHRFRRGLTSPCSYEGLPPNFSLLQNMTAGAFAGIAVSSSQPGRYEEKDDR